MAELNMGVLSIALRTKFFSRTAGAIFNFKSYPTKDKYNHIGHQIIAKYPFLRSEEGTGYVGALIIVLVQNITVFFWIVVFLHMHGSWGFRVNNHPTLIKDWSYQTTVNNNYFLQRKYKVEYIIVTTDDLVNKPCLRAPKILTVHCQIPGADL